MPIVSSLLSSSSFDEGFPLGALTSDDHCHGWCQFIVISESNHLFQFEYVHTPYHQLHEVTYKKIIIMNKKKVWCTWCGEKKLKVSQWCI